MSSVRGPKVRVFVSELSHQILVVPCNEYTEGETQTDEDGETYDKIGEFETPFIIDPKAGFAWETK